MRWLCWLGIHVERVVKTIPVYHSYIIHTACPCGRHTGSKLVED